MGKRSWKRGERTSPRRESLGWLLPATRRRRQFTRVARDRIRLESLESRQMLAVFTVDTTSDVPVPDKLTFREAITLANETAGADQITFNLPGDAPAVIAVKSALPDITDEVLIDGASQPSTGTVSLDGSGASGASGLVVQQAGSGSVIVGLRIGGFVNGIHLVSADGVNVTDCMLGSVGGGAANTASGILIDGGADARLLRVSAGGNSGSGVRVVGADSTQIVDSSLGSDAAPNTLYGLRIEGATGTTLTGSSIGNSTTVSGNATGGIFATDSDFVVIDGVTLANNGGDGISISGGMSASITASSITGSGTSASNAGIRIFGGAGHTIGGTSPAAANLIGSGKGDGIVVQSASGIVLQQNFVGTRPNGVAWTDLGNAGVGIRIVGSTGVVVTYRNVIAHNDLGGVVVSSGVGNVIGADASRPEGERGLAFGNLVFSNGISGGSSKVEVAGILVSDEGSGTILAANCIGITGPNGVLAANTGDGIAVVDASSTTIGGRLPTFAGDPVYGNLIAGNGGNGITLSGNQPGSSDTANVVRGNTIRNNAFHGILVDNSVLQVIGGNIEESVPDIQETANTIISNGTAGAGEGISIENNSFGIVVTGNFIGTNSASAAGLGNARNGIRVLSSDGNQIGGDTDAGAHNVIANNALDGVVITTLATGGASAGTASGNRILGNTVRGNGRRGITVEAASNNSIGSANPGEGNTIVANGNAGVALVAGAMANVVQGNLIGTDLAGSARLGNLGGGVLVDASTGSVIGGAAEGAGNRIAYNAIGITVSNAVATTDTANRLLGNVIDRNVAEGIKVTSSRFTVVGGMTDGEGNSIQFNGSDGVLLDGTTQAVQVLGNDIGSDADGNDLGNAGDGIQVGTPSASVQGNTVQGNRVGYNKAAGVRLVNAVQTTIGGPETDQPNTVTFNGQGGIVVQTGSRQNSITANAVTDNLAAGVSLLASSSNTLVGNQILRNAFAGILASVGSDNTIGGVGPTDGNTISANVGSGVILADSSSRNSLVGNLVDSNVGTGIVVSSGVGNKVIGGNVVTKNGVGGIMLSGTSRSTVIDSAYVGTNADGEEDLGNTGSGITIAGALANVIRGGTVVSANSGYGIDIVNATANDVGIGNVVTSAIVSDNGRAGIRISGGGRHTIGGTGAGNTLQGNAGIGIELTGRTLGNVVRGNIVSDNNAGGLLVNASTSNTIDGGNIVTANGGDGIRLIAGASGNQIRGNFIGTDAAGTEGLGNAGDGVEINASLANIVSGNTIVDHTAAAARGVGIVASSAATVALGNVVESNLIRGNTIGVQVTGSTRQTIGASRISTQAPGATANTIVANASHGVLVDGKSQGVIVVGNFIGTDAGGEIGGNAEDGIRVTAATATTVGGNMISFNGGNGIQITAAPVPAPAAANVLVSNTVRGNLANGIRIGEGSTFNVVGNIGAGNTIDANALHGITIEGASNSSRLTSNTVTGNGSADAETGEVLGGDGIRIVGSIGNVVRSATVSGNRASGVRIVDAIATQTAGGNQLLASTVSANGGDGVRIEGGGRNVIGATGLGNTIIGNGSDQTLAGSARSGIAIVAGARGRGAVGNLVQANAIGVDATGAASGNAGDGVLIEAGAANTVSLGNRITNNGAAGEGAGVRLRGAVGNIVGGVLAAARNLIAFNAGSGVVVESLDGVGSTGNQISGNSIDANGGDGVAVTGETSIGNVIGMRFDGVSVKGLGNVISNNGGVGVSVGGGIRNSILGNSIFGNAAAIALADGGNASMPAPVITSATAVKAAGATRWTITGTISKAPPRQPVVVELYASPASDAEPQARTLIGRAVIRTDATGAGTFRVTLTATVPASSLITATATSSLGNTSEAVPASGARTMAFARFI
jgi:parallel beta-helix repeat protein